MYGNSAYFCVPLKENKMLTKIEFQINKYPLSLKISSNFKGINWGKKIEHDMSPALSKVEHTLLIVKNQTSYAKIAYLKIWKT